MTIYMTMTKKLAKKSKSWKEKLENNKGVQNNSKRQKIYCCRF